MSVNRKEQPEYKIIDTIQNIKPQIKQLSNGIPVVMFDMGTQEMIRLELIFNAGSWYQKSPLIANACNQTIAEGTKKRSSSQIADEIDYYGSYLTTELDKDYASVGLYTLNRYLSETLNVLSDVVINPQFPQNEIDIFKQNSLQEHLVNNKKVNYVCRNVFGDKLFGSKHPYGVYADEKDFKSLKRQDLVAFYNDFYNPVNCTLFVSGKLPKNIMDLLEENLVSKDWKSGKKAKEIDALAQTTKDKTTFVEMKDSVQSAIRIGCKTFNRHHEDYFGMQILSTILGGYFGSRLMSNIREDKGYTYGISSSSIALKHDGFFVIGTEVGVENTQNTIKEIYFELNRLCEQPVPKDELDLVKNYLSGALLRSLDGTFAYVDRYKNIILQDLKPSYYQDYLNAIRAIDSKKLKKLAQKYFQPDAMIETIVGKM